VEVLPWHLVGQDPTEGVWTMVQVDKRYSNVEEEVQEGRYFSSKMTSWSKKDSAILISSERMTFFVKL